MSRSCLKNSHLHLHTQIFKQWTPISLLPFYFILNRRIFCSSLIGIGIPFHNYFIYLWNCLKKNFYYPFLLDYASISWAINRCFWLNHPSTQRLMLIGCNKFNFINTLNTSSLFLKFLEGPIRKIEININWRENAIMGDCTQVLSTLSC